MRAKKGGIIMSQWDLQANETSVYFKNYVNDEVVEAECHEALMNEHIKCAEEHEQLAVWLKELKQLRDCGVLEDDSN